MNKKCFICQEQAGFKIKDTADFYCSGCAEENFADLSLLVEIEPKNGDQKEDKNEPKL